MSSTKHLLDPELRAMADGPFLQNLNDAKVARPGGDADQVPTLADPQPQGLYRKEIFAPQADGPVGSVFTLWFRKTRNEASTAAYLHVHGGGYPFGNPEGSIL